MTRQMCSTMLLHWPTNTFHPNPCLWKHKIFLGVASILSMCFSAHIPNLLPSKRDYSVGFIYVLGTAAEHYINLSLVLNPLYYQ